MNRREKRHNLRDSIEAEKRAKVIQSEALKPITMTRGDLSALLIKADSEGYSRALRTAIETSFGAYTIVLGEMGFTEEQLLKVHESVSNNVFGVLDERGIDLSDIPAFAKNYGIDLLNGSQNPDLEVPKREDQTHDDENLSSGVPHFPV